MAKIVDKVESKFEKQPNSDESDHAAKGATGPTRDAQRRVLSELDFSDHQSFEDAQKGFIAPLPNKGVVKNADGAVVWNLPGFDFLAGDAAAPDTVNPSLWRDAQIMYRNAGLFKVTDGIYQVCGSDISNVTFIEGDSGVIVMDPLMSEEVAKAALDLYYEHRPKNPVVAVIITHSHIDHYGGVLGVTSEADVKAGKVKVFAPEGFTGAALNESVIGGNRETRLSGYQYSMLVERGPQGNMTSGLGLDTSKGNTTFLVPTNLITETGQKETIDGLDFEFILAPDTEAPAEMFFYIPKYKALTVAEDATFTMHNVYSLRGTTIRSSYNWAKYLRDARVKWGGEAEVLYAPHHWPIWGADRIDEHLKRHSAAYKFINDQAVRLANMGYDMVEAGEMLELPGSLGQDFSLRDYYGTMNHNVKSAFAKHFGWFNGNAATLHPLPRVPAANRYVEYMGGSDAIMDKARRDYANGDYRWVAEVLNHLVYADPSNTDAKNLLADTHEQLAYQTEAGTWRGLYLSAAKDLREGVKELPVVDFASPSTLQAMPFDLYLDGLSTRLDGPKASRATIHVNVDFTDTGAKWLLELEHGALQYYENQQSSTADVTLSLTATEFIKIAEGKTSIDDAIKAGDIKLAGSQAKLDEFLSYFITFDAWYNVVTPVEEK
jgi:alkyl sulfatase BDS1-like metallo-beta-lactamase superfamily hydrolase